MSRLGPVMAHERDAFPLGAIAPVFMVFTTTPESSCLRVGVHAAAFEALVAQLDATFKSCACARLDLFTFCLYGPQSEAVLAKAQTTLLLDVKDSATVDTDVFFDSARSLDALVGSVLTTRAAPVAAFTRFDRSGTRTKGLGQGFDLVVESRAAAKQLWLALVRAGAECIGTDDVENLHVAMRLPSFPRDYADCALHVQYWDAMSSKAEQEWLAKPASKRGSRQFAKPQPDWSLLCGSAQPVIARGWANVSAFMSALDYAPAYGLLLRCIVRAPQRHQVRFEAPCRMHQAAEEDYAEFVRTGKVDATKRRPAAPLVGWITSSLVSSERIVGLGLVSVEAWTQLLEQAKSRKNRKRRLVVLIERQEAWGVAYVSLASDE